MLGKWKIYGNVLRHLYFIAWIEAKYKPSTQELCFLKFDLFLNNYTVLYWNTLLCRICWISRNALSPVTQELGSKIIQHLQIF